MGRKRGCVLMLALDLLLFGMLLFYWVIDDNDRIMSTSAVLEVDESQSHIEHGIMLTKDKISADNTQKSEKNGVMLTGEEIAETENNMINKENGKIALTFDDGPHPSYTEKLLDGLKERGVHATFFVTGEHAKLHPDIIKRMIEEGHLIGNHTYNHVKLTEYNRDEFKEQLVKTNQVITELTGQDVLYVRPPYGAWDKNLEAELNMFPVLWSIDPLDWCTDNAAVVTQRVVSKAQDDGIILMHDYYDTSVTAALEIIDQLTAEGYEFVTVEEILFD